MSHIPQTEPQNTARGKGLVPQVGWNDDEIVVPAVGVSSLEAIDLDDGVIVSTEVEFCPLATLSAMRGMISRKTGIRRNVIKVALARNSDNGYDVIVPDDGGSTMLSHLGRGLCPGHFVVLFTRSAATAASST